MAQRTGHREKVRRKLTVWGMVSEEVKEALFVIASIEGRTASSVGGQAVEEFVLRWKGVEPETEAETQPVQGAGRAEEEAGAVPTRRRGPGFSRLSSKRRSEIARAGGLARWARKPSAESVVESVRHPTSASNSSGEKSYPLSGLAKVFGVNVGTPYAWARKGVIPSLRGRKLSRVGIPAAVTEEDMTAIKEYLSKR